MSTYLTFSNSRGLTMAQFVSDNSSDGHFTAFNCFVIVYLSSYLRFSMSLNWNKRRKHHSFDDRSLAKKERKKERKHIWTYLNYQLTKVTKNKKFARDYVRKNFKHNLFESSVLCVCVCLRRKRDDEELLKTFAEEI